MFRSALVVAAAVLVASCGKGGGEGGSAPAAPAPTLAEQQAKLAALPAPYNTADLQNGEAKFGLCRSCHSVAPGGPNLTGPNLHGVFGRRAGAVEGYHYSDALKNAGFTWDEARLEAWLADPRKDLPGTKMSFPGLQSEKDRIDVIAYLHTAGGGTP